MGRRTTAKKVGYDARVIAFQIIRRDACNQLQTLCTHHNLQGVDALTISACEQTIYHYTTHKIPIDRVYQSVYCLRYYKLFVYVLLGLPSILLSVILTSTEMERTKLFAQIRQTVQTGETQWMEEEVALRMKDTIPVPVELAPSQSSYEIACQEMDRQCGDGTDDIFTPPCRKCRTNRNVKIDTAQTRGADEGMTVKYECKKCNHKWREAN